MQLAEVEIKNFRSIMSTKFLLDNKLVSILGGNESGKSNVLKALERFYKYKTPFDQDDRYQLATNEPEITLTFKGKLSNSDFDDLFDCDVIDEIIFSRRGNEYFPIKPSIKNIEINATKAEEVNNPESNANAENNDVQTEVVTENVETLPESDNPEESANDTQMIPAATIVSQQNSAPYLNSNGSISENTLEIIFNKLPKFVYISNLNEDFLSGKNISINELEKGFTSEQGKLKTIWDFLAIGGVDNPSMLNNSDLDQRLKLYHRISSRISKKINSAWEQEDVKIRITPAEKCLVIHIRDGKNCEEKDDTTWIWTCPEDRSYGFQWYLTFYSRFLGGTAGTMKNALLLLDDPGLALNAVAQRNLINLFENLSENNQIIYTTHSPYMVDWNKTNNIYLALKQRKNGNQGTVINTNWKFRKLGELPEPLRDIGFSCAGQILNIRNLIVEGKSDKLAIAGVNNLYKFNEKYPRISLSQYRIVDAGCASDTVTLSNYASKTEGLKTLIILDKDSEGEKAKQRCDQAGLKYIFITNAWEGNTKKETIEDFMPFEKYLTAVNETHCHVYSEDWQNIKKEDFTNGHTPIVKNIEKIIREKVPSAKEEKEPLKKAFIMEKLFEICSLEDFLNKDGEFNENGKYFASLFTKINTLLK